MSRPTRQDPSGRAYLDLQNRARREQRGTQELLTLYVVERWLARLSRSSHANDFVLIGGILLAAFGQRRPTADADTLARNLVNERASVVEIVAQIAAIEDPGDGVEFVAESAAGRTIREDAMYTGIRVTINARVATAEVKPIVPAPDTIELPALRPGIAPIRVLGYPIETVLAEKLATAIGLGAANTRVRDLADIHTLVASRDVDHVTMREALMTTTRFRSESLRPLSAALGDFVAQRASAYAAYRRALGPYGEHLPEHLTEAVATAVTFCDLLLDPAPAGSTWRAAEQRWAIT